MRLNGNSEVVLEGLFQGRVVSHLLLERERSDLLSEIVPQPQPPTMELFWINDLLRYSNERSGMFDTSEYVATLESTPVIIRTLVNAAVDPNPRYNRRMKRYMFTTLDGFLPSVDDTDYDVIADFAERAPLDNVLVAIENIRMRRDYFVKEFCGQNDWDPNKLNAGQLLQVRAHFIFP